MSENENPTPEAEPAITDAGNEAPSESDELAEGEEVIVDAMTGEVTTLSAEEAAAEEAAESAAVDRRAQTEARRRCGAREDAGGQDPSRGGVARGARAVDAERAPVRAAGATAACHDGVARSIHGVRGGRGV